MQLYQKLCKAIDENDIDELGLLPVIPEAAELPPESQAYYPLVVVESKLGISKCDLAILLKEAHQHYITLSKEDHTELERVTRIMILLKPDNYTAMNRRKELILSGHIDVQEELRLVELIFTIPKHSKSSVAWYHRQWIFTHFKQLQIDMSNELRLCVMASSSYPRNYYAWTYRYWAMSTYCSGDIPLIEKEYNDTCHWIETNISDYSGFQYLQHLMKMSNIGENTSRRDQHMHWVDRLITRYPGHESLWCHRRFCSHLFIQSIEYCKLQHKFILDIINDRFKDVSLNDNSKHIIMQKDFALKFGLWHTLLEKRCHQSVNKDSVDLYLSVAPIPSFLDR